MGDRIALLATSTIRYWLYKWKTDALVYEAIWALRMNWALKASAAEQKWDADAFEMALLKNMSEARTWRL